MTRRAIPTRPFSYRINNSYYIIYIKSSALLPKSSSASSYTLVSNLSCPDQLHHSQKHESNILGPRLHASNRRLRRRLWFLLPCTALLLLLLVCQRRQPACSLAHLDILQRRSQLLHMLLDKSRVERLVLVSFDNILYNLARKPRKVFLCPRLEGYQRIELR